MNATRYPQKPLRQPTYNFSDVPKAKRDLKGSSLHRIVDRDIYKQSMAEMILLCKEAIRRRPGKGTGGGKPLSLEYIADRLDIDDPFLGYMVRTERCNSAADEARWQKGMLQGFITVTTFTNWQRSFRWDSMNEAAFDFDSEEMEADLENGTRKWDSSSELASAMQQTVHQGDIWTEGVVWPRICEVALLGGLGCGRVSQMCVCVFLDLRLCAF